MSGATVGGESRTGLNVARDSRTGLRFLHECRTRMSGANVGEGKSRIV